MGIFQKKETHESRSSSMSYAMQWRPENLSRFVVISLLVIAAIIVALIGWFGQSKKSISLVIDGEVRPIETTHSLVSKVLDEQNIVVHASDKVSRSLESTLENGDRIVIVRAIPVQVIADGAVSKHLTTQNNVDGVIKELGISLDPADKVTPSLSSSLNSNTDIRVVRVNKQTVQTKETIPFSVVKTSDADLEKGNTKVIQEGTEGVVAHNVLKVYEDGVFVSKHWLGKEVETAPKPKIIAVGTKAPTAVLSASITRNEGDVDISGLTTKGGVSFKYKKLLKNVTLTAYSSEEDGIGTKTASGTRVKQGRTIAVDKSIVPMGWWVYIEGVGFRRAEDTGGAIKGHVMDVYYDTLKDANQFGRKKGRTVYVIGPNKPELN